MSEIQPGIEKTTGMCPHGNFPDSCQECRKGRRETMVLKYLDRIHAQEVLKDDEKFFEWFKNLTFDQFKRHLVDFNGMLRDLPPGKRSFDAPETEQVGGEVQGTEYLPPAPQDKENLLREAFEASKHIKNRKDIALLEYLSVQVVHPFLDGNGRTGRLIYRLLSGEFNSPLAEDPEIKALIVHGTGEEETESPGRKKMAEKLKPVDEINRYVSREMARDLFGNEFAEKHGFIYSGLQSGAVGAPSRIGPELREKVEAVLGEWSGKNFMFRDLMLLDMLQRKGLLGEYVKSGRQIAESQQIDTDDRGKVYANYDGEKIVDELTDDDASKLIERHREFKQAFVRKMISMIAEPEKYETSDGRPIKDSFYAKEQVDLTNEEIILRILESGAPEELEKLCAFHNVTPEKIRLFSDFAKLRKRTLEQVGQEVERRKLQNSKATEEELGAGIYKEHIEPQVRGAVFALRRKGYATYESGFGGYDRQMISFEKNQLEDFELPENLAQKLAGLGVKAAIEPNRVSLTFEKYIELDEIKKIWDEIAEALPDLGAPAEPNQLRAAKSFREKQNTH